ncbi:MAG: hypothetical protein H7145_08770 [Akkermansiaceae bacterium]|nr:hypothetical protein [Armatimonadota bacterium]
MKSLVTESDVLPVLVAPFTVTLQLRLLDATNACVAFTRLRVSLTVQGGVPGVLFGLFHSPLTFK